MSNAVRIEEILEEIVASGRSPEDVCQECPHLLPVVLEQLQNIQGVQAELAALFPTLNTRSPRSLLSDSLSNGTSPTLPDLPGYTVLGVLGHGGMGVVYKARHLKLDRIVAIKMLLSGRFASPVELSRFLREAQAIAALRHPNIVQVYDVGDLEGRAYFSMEYVEGGNLAHKLAGIPQPARQCGEWVVTLAQAVQFAHTNGIVHRDLKPANILLTSTGTLKITDFGLARRYGEGPDLTLGGTRLGTPSYMSPEQALGREGTIGPSADLYSLGAMLYEMLTGRPPFHSDSAAETERQLLSDDPAPPRLLNGRIPRDLEVICLKCLQKSPGSRYASAEDLSEDLQRFLSGTPITARPISTAERTAKWVRRYPARAMLFAGCAMVALVMTGTGLWALSARATRISAVEMDLSAAVEYQRKSDWREAALAVDRASIRLGDDGSYELRERVDRARNDLQMVKQLDAIRMLRARSEGGVLNNERASKEYAEAFARAGLGTTGDDPAEIANRVANSAISKVLVAALDDWLLACKVPNQKLWIKAVVVRADRDDDPDGWRRSVRDPANWVSRQSIERLVEGAPVEKQPISFLYAFAEALEGSGNGSLAYLTRAQSAHPDDFWLTTALANGLRRHDRHAESVGYYRAAVALRPDAMASHYNLGQALGGTGQFDQAIDSFRKALECDPGAIDPLKSIGLTHSFAGRYEQALKHFLTAAKIDPDDYELQKHISWCHAKLGHFQQATDAHLRALELSPVEWRDNKGTRALLMEQGQQDLAFALWKKFLTLKTSSLDDWEKYPELALYCGDTAEYERTRNVLLERFGNTSDARTCERLARACLLMPSSPEQIARASALIDRALATQVAQRTWVYPYFQLAHALADYRSEHYSDALTIVEGESSGILNPAPELLAAMCRAKLGELPLARKHLADAAISFDWNPIYADHREAWIYHVLRREAERLVLPDIDHLLQPESVPADTATRLCLIAVCQSEQRFGRGAQHWQAVLAGVDATPETYVEPAARVLLLAGTGVGSDAHDYAETDRTAWRDLGHRLLMNRVEQLELRTRSTPETAEEARSVISGWQTAPEFGPVRDSAQLARLPKAEQTRWTALWKRCLTLTEQSRPKTP